jgi:tetratricopeptide (TPR) repeat protein
MDSAADQARRYRVFRQEIRAAYDSCLEHGRQLIIRDHAFVDFFSTQRFRSLLLDVLKEDFEINSLITVRDPVDVWLSMIDNRFTVKGPAEFCERYLEFLDAFEGVPLYRYEDFVTDPEVVLRGICAEFGLSYDSGFAERIGSIRYVTGGSGRQGKDISERPKRALSQAEASAFSDNESYETLLGRLGYGPVQARGGLQSKRPVRHIERGRTLKSEGRLEEALAEFDTALRQNPGNPAALVESGIVKLLMADPEQAVECFRSAFMANGDLLNGLLNMGNALKDLDMAEQALLAYKTCLLIDPLNAMAYNNIGTVLREHGEYELAATQFQTALQLDPHCDIARRNLDSLRQEREEATRG